MKQTLLCTVIAAVASMLFLGSEVLAQKDAPRFEIGGQFSLMSINKPTSQYDEYFLDSRYVNEPGFGGRFTYNVTNEIAFEAEGRFFPERSIELFGSSFLL